MPILDGFQATQHIRRFEAASPPSASPSPPRLSGVLNGRVPVFAVSATLYEHQRAELIGLGIDGWILKPIDFKRLREFLQGILDPVTRERHVYHPGTNWELGGWLVGGTK